MINDQTNKINNYKNVVKHINKKQNENKSSSSSENDSNCSTDDNEERKNYAYKEIKYFSTNKLKTELISYGFNHNEIKNYSHHELKKELAKARHNKFI